MFIRKIIPYLVVVLCAILPTNIVMESKSDTVPVNYSCERADEIGEKIAGYNAFCGQITDAFVLPEYPNEGRYNQPLSQLPVFPYDNVSKIQSCLYFRAYYNETQHAAYRNLQSCTSESISRLHGTGYYIYALCEIII